MPAFKLEQLLKAEEEVSCGKGVWRAADDNGVTPQSLKAYLNGTPKEQIMGLQDENGTFYHVCLICKTGYRDERYESKSCPEHRATRKERITQAARERRKKKRCTY